MSPGESVQGMALLMVLVFQLVLSLLGTAAFRDSGLQQKMVAHAWQGQSDRLIHHRMLIQLEGHWQRGQLMSHQASVLGINARDCALLGWLSHDSDKAPWQPWTMHRKTRYDYLIVGWETGVCQASGRFGAHTLVMRSSHPLKPIGFAQSLWMAGASHRSYWRIDR